jgi:hypothetical protein
VGAQAGKAVVAASFRLAAEHKPLLTRFDLLDVPHRNDEPAIAEDAAPEEELVGPIEARTEPNRLDHADVISGRVDPEAFAAAEPVVAIPTEPSETPGGETSALLAPKTTCPAQSKE